MKTQIKLFTFLLILIASMSANAALVTSHPTKIGFIQISAGAAAVHVGLTSIVPHPECSYTNSEGVSGAGGLVLYKSSEVFDEIYARLMIAEQNDEEILLADNYGECPGVGFWLNNPLIRFQK